jgi:malate dehydrogenase (oxaloacetate-decarboxylating)(NADP+)
MSKIRKQEALDYHSQGRKGKLEVVPTKPYSSQRDLSLAYSPGVAEPCKAIEKNKEDAYKYTMKGNLVGVISNGTAVLGLGDIGPEASKPVMEGKGVLFKIFADIDVFDIEVDASDVDKFVATVKAIAPTFGGINLEDIKAPEAFEIEDRLKEELDIPVMHDDQHGTAIISAAALINALELAGKKLSKIKVVFSGAGAAAMSCVKLYESMGVKKDNILMFDSHGLVHVDRTDMDKRKAEFATKKNVKDLAAAMKGCDVFVGLSAGGVVSEKMVKSMAKNPIVFALANPDPEITYSAARKARKDVIMATGRSDNPNQVNNVLGFPYIFRGALDVRARAINEEMKIAAVKAIAELAKESVPEEVNEAYDMSNITFGRDLIIPKPLDPRLLSRVSTAVAKAAVESGVARVDIPDWDEYSRSLNERMGKDNKLIRGVAERGKKHPKRVVFAEGDNYKILKAAEQAVDEGICQPVLLGNRQRINDLIETHSLELPDVEIIDPKDEGLQEKADLFAEQLFDKRKRKGMTLLEASKLMRDRNYYGASLVNAGEADALISGITRNYGSVIRPALRVIGMEEGVSRVAGMYIIQTNQGPVFFADTTVNYEPTADDLVNITLLVADAVKKLKITPRIAMLSYSNFGSSQGKDVDKVQKAVKTLHEDHPQLIVDGELQANFALNNELLKENFPFSVLKNRKTNTLIFPSLASGNIAYKLIQELGDKEAIGPILLGMKKSFHVLQMGCSVREILNMIRIAVVEAHSKG